MPSSRRALFVVLGLLLISAGLAGFVFREQLPFAWRTGLSRTVYTGASWLAVIGGAFSLAQARARLGGEHGESSVR